MSDFLLVYWLTQFRMQVVAVVVVFHILRGMKGNNSKIAPLFLWPAPMGLFGFLFCLCRTLGKGSVSILYWLGCRWIQIQITCLWSALQGSLMTFDTLLNFRPHSPHWRNGLNPFASKGSWLWGVSEETEETSGAEVQSAISGTVV